MTEKDILAAIGAISICRWVYREIKWLWSEFHGE